MSVGCGMVEFKGYDESLRAMLGVVGAEEALSRQNHILIKPNLINNSPPPITVPVSMIEALIDLVRTCSSARITVAEGAGAADLETPEVFEALGYTEMARRMNVDLLDLNHAPLRRMTRDDCRIFPEFYLPEILFETFVVSVAALKAHSLADVTLCMKNMMGAAPPSHYRQGGHWKKSAFHSQMHRSIFELNLYRAPDLCLIDGRIGMAEYHLGGPTCDPPVGKLVGGFDPVAVDAAGAGLLGVDWKSVDHIRLADGVLGQAD